MNNIKAMNLTAALGDRRLLPGRYAYLALSHMERRHLAYMGQQREREAIRRLFRSGQNPLVAGSLETMIGVRLPWSLIGFRIPYDYVCTSEKEGDIDLLFVPSVSNQVTAKNSKFDWSEAFGIEVKAAYYNTEGVLKSAGLMSYHDGEEWVANSQHDARDQANRIRKSGIAASLLHIVATEPREAFSRGIGSWIRAGEVVRDAEAEVFSKIHFEKSDPFGTMLLAIGAVPDGHEDKRGSWSGFMVLNEPATQSDDSAPFVSALRTKFEAADRRYEGPPMWPVIFLACSSRKCRNLYRSRLSPLDDCPLCGSSPC